MKAKRQLLKIHVNFISLVSKGANRKVIIWKSAHPFQTDLSEKFAPVLNRQIQIAKIDEDERIVYGIVYAPDEVDTEGDMATAEVIKEAAYEFMENLKNDQIDKSHDEDPDEGYVAESWIVKENDSIFEEIGAWAVAIKVTDDKTWKEIKDGEITGLSMGGRALAEELEKGDDMKFNKEQLAEIGEALKKAWYEIRVSGDLPGGGDDTPSVQDQLAGVFKDSKVFEGVKTPEAAEAALSVVKEFMSGMETQAREVLKDHLPEVKPEADAKPVSKDADPELVALAGIVKTAADQSIAPLVTKFDGLETRLKAIEDMPLGSFGLSPSGETDEGVVNKDGKRVIQFMRH